ncbi:MAG: cadmium-translocating P-type ATPase [Clostridiales bacterium]|jgi:Cd2+/Zn2+-exporting ATPase|nr:cadmium-translocating P-type ATPase [Clostridiales bacterium]
MKSEYTLSGVDCAHCAAKIEKSICRLNRVESANLNFALSSLTVYTEGDCDVSREISDTIKKIEPEARIEERTRKKQKAAEKKDASLSQVISGAALLIAALLAVRFNSIAGAALFAASYVAAGGDVVVKALKNIARLRALDENFLMTAASLGAMAIGEFPEAAAVMLFYKVGEYFQDKAVRNSRASISDLMQIRPDYANVVRNGEVSTVPPEMVEPGEKIIVKPGEKIPLDGVIIEGSSTLDTSSLTGESLPRTVTVGDDILSGGVNKSGLLDVRVSKPFKDSTVSKILDLIENTAAKKSRTENFITVFARYYTPAVIGLAALIALIPVIFFGGDSREWVGRGLLFLVVSCPCALVISVPLGFFGGIGAASRRGALIKGGNFLEALNAVDTVAFDKTGTLTKGALNVSAILPANGFTKDETLKAAAFAEAFSTHPIAAAIREKYGGEINGGKIKDYVEEAGRGVSAYMDGANVLAGSADFLRANGVYAGGDEGTLVAVSGKYAGRIIIEDEIRPDSRKAIERLKKLGVKKIVMLTGDMKSIAEKVAAEVGVDETYARLLPHEKVAKLESLGGKTAFVGDGINDAPSLARANVGVAMGGLGSDAAIEAADVVIMTDEPSKLADAISVAKATKRVVWQNIVFALSVKLAALILGALGMASMWAATLADVGVAFLAVLNSARIIYYKPREWLD